MHHHLQVVDLLLQTMGYHSFHQLAHHVLVGNQIIVQTDSYMITKSIIDCLQVKFLQIHITHIHYIILVLYILINTLGML